MKRSDLNVGDRVRIYRSGTINGWAEILELDATPGPHDRHSYTVRVRFLPGQVGFARERNFALRDIAQKQTEEVATP